MPPPERLTAGSIFFAYQARPAISSEGTITGSKKDVVSMEWLDADDLAVPAERGEFPQDGVLAPFMCLAPHEHHVIGLPMIKVPYTMNFSKTCEQAERVDRTYLAITPSENTVRVPSKRFDTRYQPLDGSSFPVQKIYKDPKTGRPMPEWDTFIDLATPISITEGKIEWNAEIYKAPVSEVVRFLRLYRFVNGLDFDVPDYEELDTEGEPLDIDDRDRTQKRPTELLGPGVRRQKVERSSPSDHKKAGLKQQQQKLTPPRTAQRANPQLGSPPGKSSWAAIASNVADPVGDALGQGWQEVKSHARPQWPQSPTKSPESQQTSSQHHEQGSHQQNFFGSNNSGSRRGQGNSRARSGGRRGRRGGRGNYNSGWEQPGIPQDGNSPPQQNEPIANQKVLQGAQPTGQNDHHEAGGISAVIQSEKTARQFAVPATGGKNNYDFAKYIRTSRANKIAKPDIIPHPKDSAERISDADRTTWNKESSQLNLEPWPEDWPVLKPGETMIEGIKDVPTREGWDVQQPNKPWWIRVQEWLGLEGDARVFKGWEYPDPQFDKQA
ncbi:hypothetical protein Dda_3166 [Drechslerella dactyloides]|uniref:Uncharacterized protein n=1 Tax=Drechslerella dactyloides TaxID=74499 RepID=A0AAD6NMK9_DREDA|nr:hypothetical protein Dda_3166 [Drechslerella dactyloides]